MASKVHIFKEAERTNNDIAKTHWIGRFSIIGTIKTDRYQESTQEPIMKRVDEYSVEGHGITAESVNE